MNLSVLYLYSKTIQPTSKTIPSMRECYATDLYVVAITCKCGYMFYTIKNRRFARCTLINKALAERLTTESFNPIVIYFDDLSQLEKDRLYGEHDDLNYIVEYWRKINAM